MNIGVPQIIAILLYVTSLFYYAHKHGQQREDTYNFWYLLISTAIWATILYFGGFWTGGGQ